MRSKSKSKSKSIALMLALQSRLESGMVSPVPRVTLSHIIGSTDGVTWT